jgi:guanine deaminase
MSLLAAWEDPGIPQTLMSGSPGLRRIHKGLVVNPVSAESSNIMDPGYLVVSGGKIDRVSLEDPRPDYPDAEFMDHGKKSILPGLIDTHVHLPQFAIMGTGGELLTWLNKYTYPEEARFADVDYAQQITHLFFDALIANGTTTASIYCSVHEEATDIAFRVAREMGIRAFIGKVMMDRNSPEYLQETTEESVRASVRLFERWDGACNGRLRYVFTPRFAGSCSMELMAETGRIAGAAAARVQTHLSENRDEVLWVRSLFPEHQTYADVYSAAGLLGERSTMAHCIHLSAREIRLLAETRTNIAFCPYSNVNLRSGTMPYAALQNAGLRIGLGSDIAGGPSISMLRQMEVAEQVAGISRSASLYLATLGGAETLGIADRVGSLAPGKDADFILVTVAGSVDQVWIRGELKTKRQY